MACCFFLNQSANKHNKDTVHIYLQTSLMCDCKKMKSDLKFLSVLHHKITVSTVPSALMFFSTYSVVIKIMVKLCHVQLFSATCCTCFPLERQYQSPKGSLLLKCSFQPLPPCLYAARWVSMPIFSHLAGLLRFFLTFSTFLDSLSLCLPAAACAKRMSA